MKKTEARKRVARALVRVFFRDLYSIVELDNSDKIEDEKRGIEDDMANGLSRSDKDHSNISFPSPITKNIKGLGKVKVEKTEKLLMK